MHENDLRQILEVKCGRDGGAGQGRGGVLSTTGVSYILTAVDNTLSHTHIKLTLI